MCNTFTHLRKHSAREINIQIKQPSSVALTSYIFARRYEVDIRRLNVLNVTASAVCDHRRKWSLERYSFAYTRVTRSHKATRCCNVFGILPSQSASGFWPYPLSLGLAISPLVCLDFAFHLCHLQCLSRGVIFISHLHMSKPSGTWVPLSRCLHFSHDLVSSFLFPTAACTFQLCVIMAIILQILQNMCRNRY